MSDAPTGTTNPSSDHPNPVPHNPVERQAETAVVPQPRDPTVRAGPITTLAQANFVRPRAKLHRRNLTVKIGHYEPDGKDALKKPSGYVAFAEELYSYLELLFENSNGGTTTIHRVSFVRMAVTLLIFRVQQVREHRLAQRAAANRVALTRTFPVPAALYEVLAGIGEIYLEHRGFSYVPNLPAVSSPVADYYNIDSTITMEWITFMDTLNKRNLHRSVSFPNLYEGTPYWILNRTAVEHFVTVAGTTGEGTPADGLLRAVIDISKGVEDEREGFIYVDNIDYHSLLSAYFSMN